MREKSSLHSPFPTSDAERTTASRPRNSACFPTLTKKKEDILRAVMLEPHTAAELSIDDMAKMIDELIAAHGEYMAMYH